MFVASVFVEVWRSQRYQEEYSEYSEEPETVSSLVYQKAGLHMTPYSPSRSENSQESWQATKFLGTCRSNIRLLVGDELRASDGRSWEVETAEFSSGVFFKSSQVYTLREISPTVR